MTPKKPSPSQPETRRSTWTCLVDFCLWAACRRAVPACLVHGTLGTPAPACWPRLTSQQDLSSSLILEVAEGLAMPYIPHYTNACWFS